MPDQIFEYLVIFFYMAFLLGLGFAFKKFNRNSSDYFRSGAQGTWWLVGTSLFIGAISSSTFTATAGLAFDAGLTAIAVNVGFWIGILINVLFLARWFRQLRCITFPEVLRLRFSTKVETLYSCTSLFLQLIFAAITLWSVATFTSAVFGFNLVVLILIIGLVILIYSTSGGRWAVMATDFLQGIILIPMAILLAYLSLQAIGGFEGLFSAIKEQGLVERFAFVKPYDNGMFEGNNYTLGWVLAGMTLGIVFSCSLGASVRYFSTKDGTEAQKAAGWHLFLTVFGMIIFIIPPIVARLLYAPEVAGFAGELSKPEEAAYAVSSMNLLPAGLLGLMVTAMFAASMANIDTGLNANAAIFIQNIRPLFERIGLAKPLGDAAMLGLSRRVSVAFGLLIITIALYFAGQNELGIFEVMLEMMGMFMLPLVIPVLMAVFIPGVPSWTPFVVVGASVVPSLIRLMAVKDWIPFDPWNYQFNIVLVLSTGVIVFLLCMRFYKRESEEYKTRVREFYERMHRPVNFKEEVGLDRDAEQMKMVGGFVALVGFFVSFLLLVPNEFSDKMGIVFVSGFIFLTGGGMWLRGRVLTRRMEDLAGEENP